MKRTQPSKRRNQTTRKRRGATSASRRRRVAPDAGAMPNDVAPRGWPSDDDRLEDSNPTGDSLWDWDVEEIDYAQDLELEQYARRVLRGEHDD